LGFLNCDSIIIIMETELTLYEKILELNK